MTLPEVQKVVVLSVAKRSRRIFALNFCLAVNMVPRSLGFARDDKVSEDLNQGVKAMQYDYLVVGAGLYGAVFARQLTDAGKRVLVIDRREHIGGNVYTENLHGIHVHKYGAHIFHTNDEAVWNYVNRFAAFNDFINTPKANYKGTLYDLPFNMHTFEKMWGVTDPEDARAIIEQQRQGITDPQNLEEQAISLVGIDVYQKLVKGYTEKQWGRDCKDLPAFIIRRLPVRFTYDNNYFNARFQGIPIGGYTAMVENMLNGIEVRLGVDYLKHRQEFDESCEKILYTGPIDEYYDYCYGPLEYRSVRFRQEVLNQPRFQDTAVVNYTDRETPWTRIIEHKHFDPVDVDKTVISREYSSEWTPGQEAYYPVNDEKNSVLYEKYRLLGAQEQKILFGGRLAEYRYYDMDAVIGAALKAAEREK